MEKAIASFDRKMLFNVLRDSWTQSESAWKSIDVSSINSSNIKNVIITGLGGSAISGDLLCNFLRDELKVSLTVNRTYSMPGFAGENTLVIASSYSGNTEETLAAVRDALERKCMIIAMTTGGELAELAAEKGILCVSLKEGYQPRYALYNSFFRLLRVFQELGLVRSQDEAAAGIIEKLKVWGAGLSSPDNEALSMAKKIKGNIPVIYSVTGLNESAGRRLKGQLNENSKVHAWNAEYPEMNHNEIVGWETAGGNSGYLVINITDPVMNKRVAKRFDVINFLIKEQKIDILNIEGKSATFKERLLECIYLCDWISYYLAILNEKDPGEIDFIHYLKKKMSEV